MPVAEVDVDESLVRHLLGEQHADLAALPLRLVANGWDNVLWRLGEDLAVRVPRRRQAAALVEHEQRWLPELAPRLPVPVPVPVRTGGPTAGYPWHWSVVPWLAGSPAAHVPAAERDATAEQLAEFVLALHIPAPPDAPHNPVRGVPLSSREDAVRERLATGAVPHAARVEGLWEELVRVPHWEGPPSWVHGDLHPANLLLDAAGGLAAVLDFGDMTAGDPATDLATAWLTLDAPARRRFADALGGHYDDAAWQRGRGWALCMATAMVAHSDDEPVLAAVGRETLCHVLDG
ncbi:aminoglycoside phosphotransferase (APT) family kinase protein [Georgenia soli]|uniref:Aminoglycoside phosphotransferase (APT) family kinase protein n=1 Tax=Georgenia soli TaxID=638953 RepID=A0A2A9EP42_9MICO|nr:aminoglycoside phosphotransferase (APT) family kinase protein [Georgenia soli]